MKDNELEVEVEETETDEETQVEEETTDEDTQDEDTQEDDANDTPTLEDYNELEKKLKTLEAQKAHWRKKASVKETKQEEQVKTENINKDNKQTSEAELIELARLASKYSDEDIELLKEIKEIKKLDKLSDAVNTPFFKINLDKRKAEELKAKASLGTSKTLRSSKGDTVDDLKKAWLGK